MLREVSNIVHSLCVCVELWWAVMVWSSYTMTSVTLSCPCSCSLGRWIPLLAWLSIQLHFVHTLYLRGTCSSIIGWGIMLLAGRSRVHFTMRSSDFSVDNPSSYTVALMSTQPLTEITTKTLPGVKGSWRKRLTSSPSSVSWLSGNVVALTSHNPVGLYNLLQEKL
jgi:hypothetical protein